MNLTFLNNYLPKILRTVGKYVPAIERNLDKTIKVEKPLLNPLPKELILNAFLLARQWHLNRINTNSWAKKAENAGFTKEEIPKLRQELTTQLNSIKFMPKDEYLKSKGLKIKTNNSNTKGIDMNLLAQSYRILDPKTNEIFNGIELLNPRKTYQEVYDNFLHEIGHGMTSGLNSTALNKLSKSPIILLSSKKFPLTQRLVDYNSTLIPKQTVESIQARVPKQLSENGKKYYLDYIGNTTEQMARAYVGNAHIMSEYAKSLKEGTKFDLAKTIMQESRKAHNMTELYTYGGPKAIDMFFKVLGLGVPVGIGLEMNKNSNKITN